MSKGRPYALDDPRIADVVARNVIGKPREEVFTVPEGGEIVLQFPASLSPDTFQDFQDWLKIAVRKIGRLVRSELNKTSDETPSDS